MFFGVENEIKQWVIVCKKHKFLTRRDSRRLCNFHIFIVVVVRENSLSLTLVALFRSIVFLAFNSVWVLFISTKSAANDDDDVDSNQNNRTNDIVIINISLQSWRRRGSQPTTVWEKERGLKWRKLLKRISANFFLMFLCVEWSAWWHKAWKERKGKIYENYDRRRERHRNDDWERKRNKRELSTRSSSWWCGTSVGEGGRVAIKLKNYGKTISHHYTHGC